MRSFEGINIGTKMAMASAVVLKLEQTESLEHNEEALGQIQWLQVTHEKLKTKMTEQLQKAQGTWKDSDLEILEGHLEMLDDPILLEEIIHCIQDHQILATQAVDQIIQEYKKQMLQVEDSYFQQRAQDMQDIANQWIALLKGQAGQDFSLLDQECIIVAKQLSPWEILEFPSCVQGFITEVGGQTSHIAILAQNKELAALVGIHDYDQIQNGQFLIIDAQQQKLIVDPPEQMILAYQKQKAKQEQEKELQKKYIDQRALTKEGHSIHLAANISGSKDLAMLEKYKLESVGLFRSEFLYMDQDHLPTVEEQFQEYKKVAHYQPQAIKVIRTLDIGGDKSLSYMDLPKENNPFLGQRGLRLTLAHPQMFEQQLQAILASSAYGKVGILLPMVCQIQELIQAKHHIQQAQKKLDQQGLPYDDHIPLGIMIETPASALMVEQFCHYVDFFSIGTNDLTQYTLAVDRENPTVDYLYHYLDPSVLKLIFRTIEQAHLGGKWVGVCGQMAGDPLASVLLLGMGLDEWSMNASKTPLIKSVLSKITFNEAKQFMQKALSMESAGEVQQKCQEFLDQFQ